MDVLLDQLHVSGKTRLALAQDDLEFLLLGRLDHAVEVGPQAVHAGIVFITENGVNVPPVVDGVAGQQRLLVLDTF